MMGVKEDLELLDEMSDRLGLDEEQKEKFVRSSMARFGYKERRDWDEPDENDDNDDNDDDDFFSSKRKEKKRQQRDVTGNGRSRNVNDDGKRNKGDWQYG